MRHGLANLAVSFLAGCSFIYDPNKIGTSKDAAIDTKMIDAMPDAEIILDADPAKLEIDSVEPESLLEGLGDGGGRPEVLVLHGHQMVAGATVTVAAVDTAHANHITVLDAQATVAEDGNTMAVTVKAEVDPDLNETDGGLPLLITVTQPDGKGGMVSVPADWKEDGLSELDAAPAPANPLSGVNVFSRINVTSGSLPLAGTSPIVLRSTSSLTLTSAINISASGKNPGVGGANAGGPASTAGAGPSPGEPGGSGHGGGGGGFGTVGGAGAGGTAAGTSGDALVSSYTSNQSSGGGGGADVGGGGGGTIELTANGTCTVPAITSNGGAGAGGGLGGAGAGGGSGGLIIVRGVMVMLNGALTVGGGALGMQGTLGGGNGGAGGLGRIRIDTPSAIGGTAPANAHNGLTFDVATPSVTGTSTPTITVHGTKNDQFDLHVLDSTGAPVGGTNVFNGKFEAADKVTIKPVLAEAGAYQLCLTPMGAGAGVDEATNCIHIAFVPAAAQ